MTPSSQGTWVVVSYRSDGGIVAPDVRIDATLTIEGAQIAGSMGLNRFVGQIEEGLILDTLATTRMAGPPELMRKTSSSDISMMPMPSRWPKTE